METEKAATGKQKIVDGIIGALVAGVSLVPLTIFIETFFYYLLSDVLSIEHSSNADDFMIIYIILIPIIIFGAFGGVVGGSLARKQHFRIVSYLGSTMGGLIVALSAVILISGMIFNSWIEQGKEYRVKEMRPASNKPIYPLSGKFQEISSSKGIINTFAISADGKMLAYVVDNQIFLWDLEENAQKDKPLTGHTKLVYDLAFSPDGSRLVSGGYDQKVIVWSVSTGEQGYVLNSHNAKFITVAVSPDNSLLASGDNFGNIILWKLDSGQEFHRLKMEGELFCLDFSPNGALLAACSIDPDGVVLWEVENFKPAGKLELPYWANGSIYDVDFSPNGESIAGSALFGPFIWNVQTRQPIGAVQKIDTYDSINFSPDGRYIVSTNDEGVYIWAVSSRQPVGKLVESSAEPSGALFLPDGRILATYWYKIDSNQEEDCCLDCIKNKIGIWSVQYP